MASIINYTAGETIAGAAIIAPDGNGHICLDASTAVHFVIDYHGALAGG